MIYVGDINLLSEKDYKVIVKELPNKLLLFAKKNATIPVTKAVSFSEFAAKVKFEIIETEDSDARAYYIGRLSREDEIKLITDIGISHELLTMINPQTKKRRTSRNKVAVDAKSSVITEKNEAQINVTSTKSTTSTTAKKDGILPKTEKLTHEVPETKTPKSKQAISDNSKLSVKENKDKVGKNIIPTFIKQMSVRCADLKDFDGDNNQLAITIAKLLANSSRKTEDLLTLLKSGFSEGDAKIVYSWIRPNIKKLTELAMSCI